MSSITGKRGSTESPAGGGGGGVTEKKRARLELDHDHRLVATSEEDLDLGVSRFACDPILLCCFLFLFLFVFLNPITLFSSSFECKTED